MATKHVEQILTPPPASMVGDGFWVHNFFPNGYNLESQRMSPFFLLDYNPKMEIPPSDQPRGLGVHPHRGLETVMIVYQGKIVHHDSHGNSAIISAGDIQWMTAGAGILHKEYYDAEYNKEGGLLQMVQLWINLPQKAKMSKPKYQAIRHEELSQYHLPFGGGIIEVIAGNYMGVGGIISTFSPLELYNVKLKKGTCFLLNLPANYNTGILVVEGNVVINDNEIAPADHFVLFKNEGDEIILDIKEDSILLVMSGEPINEPVFASGPIVMNTKEEVTQAFDDVNSGKFGKLD